MYGPRPFLDLRITSGCECSRARGCASESTGCGAIFDQDSPSDHYIPTNSWEWLIIIIIRVDEYWSVWFDESRFADNRSAMKIWPFED